MLFFISYHLRSKYRKKELFSNSIKNIYSDSDSFVLLSDSQKNIFKTYIKLDNITKLTAINNPINCDMSITENTIIDKKNKLLWCGRVEYGQKRLDRMIEVWKKITVEYPEWELIVIGGGSTDYFENIVKTEMIPNVYFTGFTNPEKWYSEGDILCMTSSSEGWGMVLVEAMMHGCVPIAYDSFTAIDDIILDGYNGFKIPSYKKDLFIERLKYLMEDKSLRHQLSKNGIKYIERFDKKKIAAKWIALFEKVLSE